MNTCYPCEPTDLSVTRRVSDVGTWAP